MRVVLFEWCMACGRAAADATIAREGRIMLESLAADAAREPAHEVAVVVEAGTTLDLPAAVRRVEVPAGGAVDAVAAAARAADWTLVVAPETDGVLAAIVRSIRAAGGSVLAPTDRAIEVATDKQACIESLAARGIPVPAGRGQPAATAVPPEFHLPAVRKPLTGCGGVGFEVLTHWDAAPTVAPSRLEAFARGTSVGCSCICGPAMPIPLPPLRQCFSPGAPPRYVGGEPLDDAALAARATRLATRAVHAVGIDAGWAGVDMILGDHTDGRDDRVLEVNPRVTTSFVGLSRLFSTSLVAAMIEAVTTGAPPRLVPAAPRPAEAGGFRLPAD